MLQIDGHNPRVNGQDLTQVVRELRERNEALRYLTRWRAVRESYQVQALRRSMHAITDGLMVNIPFRTGGWCIEPHLETGGQFGGSTGPELFTRAIAAVREIAAEVGLACE